MFGHGREIRSLKFRCTDCNITNCEVLPYEDIFEPIAKPQPVQVRIDTSENGTIGARIDNGYTLWALSPTRVQPFAEGRSSGAGAETRKKPQRHAQGPGAKANVLGVRIERVGNQCHTAVLSYGPARAMVDQDARRRLFLNAQ